MYIFPYKSIRKQIWPCRKKVKVNPRSSFEQTLFGPSPQCYTPSPKVIGHLVQEKKIFEGFLLYMCMVAILVRWPISFEQTFIPPIPLRLHMKFGFDWPSGFWGEDVGRVWTMNKGSWQSLPIAPHEPKGSDELNTRGPLVLYRSPECIGCAELE